MVVNCKACGQEIGKGVKKCVHCGADQRNFFGKHKIITGILAIVVIVIIASAMSGGDKTAAPTSSPTNTVKPAEQPKAPPMVVTADKLMADLRGNALNASNTYEGKYVEVTGKLSNIDSGGKYFDVAPINEEFTIIGIQCYITEEQKATVAKLTKGQRVTAVGTISDVGEVMGYSLKVESIK